MEKVSFSHGALQTCWKSAKAVRQRQLGTTRSSTEIEGRLKRIVSEPLIPSLIYFLFTKFKILSFLCAKGFFKNRVVKVEVPGKREKSGERRYTEKN